MLESWISLRRYNLTATERIQLMSCSIASCMSRLKSVSSVVRDCAVFISPDRDALSAQHCWPLSRAARNCICFR